MRAFRVWLFIGLISACSNSNPPADGGTDAGNDVTTGKDAGSDVTQGADAPVDSPADVTSDASDGGSGNFTLTINDYLSWCNVSVNGQDAGNSPGTYQFAPDASVALAGDTANALSFYWGYWQAPNLADGGKDTNKNVNITMNGNVTVLACCPVNNTALSCP
jgi:hypothetical protein